MILNEFFGNIKDLDNISHYHIETVILDKPMECNNFKITSDHNHEYEISIPNRKLQDGDIILKDGHNLVVVSIATDEVLVIKPKTMIEMGEIAHSLVIDTYQLNLSMEKCYCNVIVE